MNRASLQIRSLKSLEPSLSRLLCCGLLCLVLFANAAFAQTEDVWYADLSSPEGRREVLTSFLVAHPNLMRQPTRFRVDPIPLLAEADKLLTLFQPNHIAQDQALRMAPGVRLSYSGPREAGELEYNEANLNLIRTEILQSLRMIRPFLTAPLTHLDQDLTRFAELELKQKSAFLVLVPLLYNSGGTRKNGIETMQTMQPEQTLSNELADERLTYTFLIDLESSIRSLTGHDLYALYRDLYKEHLLKKIAPLKTWQDACNRVQNQFIERLVLAKLAPSIKGQSGGETKNLSLTLEQIPKLMTLFRGIIGADCSTRLLPFYGLIPSVHVFWIRKGSGFSTDPNGYLLVKEIEHKGKITPYIITINGAALTATDARLAILMIANHYQSSVVLTSPHKFSVNTEPMREAFWQPTTRGNVTYAQLPPLWSIVENFTSEYLKPTLHDNFYGVHWLSLVKEIELTEEELSISARSQVRRPKLVYRNDHHSDLQSLPLVDRAFLSVLSPSLKESLNISDLEQESAKYLAQLNDRINGPKHPPYLLSAYLGTLSPFTLSHFHSTMKSLQASPQSLSRYVSPRFKAKFLSGLHRERLATQDGPLTSTEFDEWTRQVQSQLITNLRRNLKSNNAPQTLENLYDLLNLPQVENTQHYFAHRLYLEDLQQQETSSTFQLMLWDQLKNPTPDERNLIMSLIQSSSMDDQLSFAKALRELRPQKWTREIWAQVFEVFKGSNEQAKFHITEALFVFPDMRWPKKLVQVFLHSKTGPNTAHRFLDALTRLKKWPSGTYEAASDILSYVQNLPPTPEDVDDIQRASAHSRFVARYAKESRQLDQPWSQPMLGQLLNVLTRIANDFETMSKLRHHQWAQKLKESDLDLLKYLYKRKVWDEESFAAHAPQLLKLRLEEIRILVVDQAQYQKTWSLEFWQLMLTELQAKTSSTGFRYQILSALLTQNQSPLPDSLLPQIRSIIPSLPEHAQVALIKAFPTPTTCRDIF